MGVWYVRENMRELFRSQPVQFDTLDEAIAYISKFMKVEPSRWTGRSKVVPALKYNNLDRYFRI